jgi:hypothetical protein
MQHCRRLVLRVVTLALAALVATALPATAATVTVEDGPAGRTIVTVRGDIMDGDRERLAAAVAGRSSVLVVFASHGGWTREGIAMGELIRLRQFDTAVATGAECASACALAWLGGVTRYLEVGSLVGFHAAYTVDDDGINREAGPANAMIGAYLTNLGFGPDAVMWVSNASPNTIAYLDETAAAEVGISFVRVPLTIATAGSKSLGGKREPEKILAQKDLAVLDKDPAAELQSLAEAFLDSHFAAAQAADGNPDYVANHYAANVRYAGQDFPRDSIVEFRAAAAAGWPVGTTWLTAAPTVTCPYAGRCTIEGNAAFLATNEARDARAEGTFDYSFVVAIRGGDPLILSEEIVERDRTVSAVTPYLLKTVQDVEEALSAAGCEAGVADGLWDPASADALQRFAAATGVNVPGEIGPETLGTIQGTVFARSIAGTGPACAPSEPLADAAPDGLSAAR